MNSTKTIRPLAPSDEGQTKGAASEQANTPLEQANLRTDAANLRTAQADLRTGNAELRSEVLRASELSYRRLFETSQDGILILDATTGMIVDVNPYLVELLGYSHEVFLGKKVWELGFFKNLVANEANFLELQQKEYLRYEDMPLETSDGRQIEVEFVSNVYRVDEQKVIQCQIRDITARKQAETARRESEEKYRNLVDNLSSGIVIHGVDTGIVLANPMASSLLGLTSDQMRGKTSIDPSWCFLRADGSSMTLAEYPVNRVFSSGEGFKGQELGISRPDRTETVWVTCNAYPVKSAQGQTVQAVVTFTDITERKQVEQALHEISVAMQHKNAELERFLYTASHDLKSPVVTVRTFLGYLEQDMASGDAGRITSDLNFIRAAADKMANLLDDLLEMSRIGRVVGPSVRVTFRQLVDDALAAVAGQLTERGVTVLVGDGTATVFGDRMRLAEVLQNLLDNACKFMGDQQAPRIEVGFETRDAEVVFFVRDNGKGIDPRFQVKAFDLFEKLEPGTEGSGLGLALVKRIVELHGGRIWVESAGVAQGACFYFTLPVVDNQTNEREKS